MSMAAWAMAGPTRFRSAQAVGRLARVLRRGGTISSLPPPLAAWTRARDAPVPPAETFRHWWNRTHKDADDLP